MPKIKTKKIKTPEIWLPFYLINRHPSKRISLSFLEKKSKKLLSLLQLKDSSVQITLVDDVFMKKVKREFFRINQTTDVLSFPARSKQKTRAQYQGRFLGDILISLDEAQKQALAQKISLQKEVLFLVVHAVLHLIGFDHALKAEKLEMQELERTLYFNL